MTNNHLLIYRLAELMLEKQQHILPLDDLFEDEQIGSFVRSIQIDSPYQQLIFEGVLTETIKEERVMVTFTVEGYFHYVLGEVIEQQTEGKGAEALKELLENNQLRGITEGVEQCLVRDVEKDDLSRLMWLIDEGGKALEASAYPLAQAFLTHPIEKVIDELLADPTDNDIEVLKKAILRLESAQKNEILVNIYKYINRVIKPDNLNKARICAASLKFTNNDNRKEKLKILEELSFKKKNGKTAMFYYEMGVQHEFIDNYEKAIKFYQLSEEILIEVIGDNNPNLGKIYSNIGKIFSDKGDYENALFYYNKTLKLEQEKLGKHHPSLSSTFNNIGTLFRYKGNYDKSIYFLNKALNISLICYGAYHPETAAIYGNFGVIFSDKEDHEKALEHHLMALEIKLNNFGEYHQKTAISMNNVGLSYKSKGEYNSALKYYLKALNINQIIFGEETSHTVTNYSNISGLYLKLEDHKKSLEFCEKSLKVSLKVFGNKHHQTGIIYNNLGSVYIARKEMNMAKKKYELAFNILSKKLGVDHPNTQFVKNKLDLINDQ